METKILLNEDAIPRHWYNVVADMPNPPAPPLGPNGQPLTPDALSGLFPQAVIEQEAAIKHTRKTLVGRCNGALQEADDE